jgi:hypothetical protein
MGSVGGSHQMRDADDQDQGSYALDSKPYYELIQHREHRLALRQDVRRHKRLIRGPGKRSREGSTQCAGFYGFKYIPYYEVVTDDYQMRVPSRE